MAGIRIIDVKGALVRAPTVTFSASELGLADFGRNISNAVLVQILSEQAIKTPNLDVIQEKAQNYAFLEQQAHIFSTDSQITAELVIAADGRNSPTRQAANIATRQQQLAQTALTFHVHHTRDHEDISTEFHTSEGPFTLVPLGANLSSVVWMMKPKRAERLLALSKQEFTLEAERQCQSLLGALELSGEIGQWPLMSLVAQRFTAPRLALVGEAAHAFAPIGAQGLNLGLRDAAEIVKLATGADLSSQDLLKHYDSNRRIDIEARSAAINFANRSLISPLLPVDIARSLAFTALSNFSPLRKLMMRIGMGKNM